MVRASVVALILCAWLGGARGQEIAGAAGRPGEAILVGRGGETFIRDGATATWRRRGGGVAGGVVAVAGAAANDFLAMGASTPAYRHDAQEWSARPIAHGGVGVLAGPGSSVTAVAVGRRISVELRGEDSGMGPWHWQDLPLAPAQIEAFFAASLKDAVAAGNGGRLWRLADGTWKPIAMPTGAAPDSAAAMVASPNGRTLVTIGRAGSMLNVDRTRASRVVAEDKLGVFRAQLAAVAGAKVFVVGQSSAWILATLDKGKLIFVAELPAVAAGDEPVALLADDKGAALVATRHGVVFLRDAAGAWTTEHVDPAAWTPGNHPIVPPAPAH